MAPRVDPVASDEALPASTGVVVIGGGIIGTCTAFFLARKGVPVTLCEKGHIAGEQSSRNWGWCRKMGRDPREIPLAIEALRLWGEMNDAVQAETGFRRSGIVYLCKTPDELAKKAAWLEAARPYQLDTRMLTRAEAAEKLPGLAGDWAGALYTESDGRGEPQMAAPAIATAARRLGATILTQCAVRGIETQAGRVAAVVTEKGRIACDSVVVAGGVWSSLFCGNHDIRLPQLKVLSSVMRTETAGGRAGDLGQRRRLRLPQASRRRLQRRELGQQRVRPDARRVPLPAGLPAGGEDAAAELPHPRGPRIHRGLAGPPPLVARRDHAVRAGAHARSGTASADPRSGARRDRRGVSGVPRHADRRALGRHDRRDARISCR